MNQTTDKNFDFEKGSPKYRSILETLQNEILNGKYAVGTRFPSEAALIQRFGTSRITVGRAVRELRLRGLVERQAGSGTFVSAKTKPAQGYLFGLIIPDLGETEIFEPICQGLVSSSLGASHALLWGHMAKGAHNKEELALELCSQYIERNVSGVFFAPFERSSSAFEVNKEILNRLAKAQVPVVLLDRDWLPYPDRSKYDLVGIDNRRAGYRITNYLLSKRKCKRIAFVSYPQSASTIASRIGGYREALYHSQMTVDDQLIKALDPTQKEEVQAWIKGVRPDAIICGNDRTAGQLMQTLLSLHYQLPKDMLIAGIDDVHYAHLLPVPLTTIHQPCHGIGVVAMATMLENLAQPPNQRLNQHSGMPPRDILLDCHLVIRNSC